MAEPARVLQLVEHRSLSPDAVDALVTRVELANEEADAFKQALLKEKRAHARTRKELADVLEKAADGDEIKAFVEWWRDYTGRGPRTETGPATERAKAYRKLRRKWSAREIAVMAIGIHNDPWRSKKGMDDIPDLAGRPDHWYEKGLEVRGGKA